MDVRLSFAHNFLRIVATTSLALNELILLSSQWIISPSPPSIAFPHPALTAAAYAVTECLYVTLLPKIGVAPWILLMTTPQHLWVCELSIEYLSRILPSKPRQSLALQFPGSSGTDDSRNGPAGKSDSERQPNISELQAWKVYTATLLPVQSAAACNASLLLFAAGLDASLEDSENDTVLMFGYLAILLYLGSRYADVRIARRTHKAPLYKRQPLTSLKLQLSCLVLLFSLKVFVRTLLGQNLLPFLPVMASGPAESHAEQGLQPWIRALAARTPAWVPLIFATVTIPLSIYGALQFRLGLRDP